MAGSVAVCKGLSVGTGLGCLEVFLPGRALGAVLEAEVAGHGDVKNPAP